MRSSVYLLTSNVASARPDHECSQDLAQKIIAARFARPIGRNTIQLIVEESWQTIKAIARSIVNGVVPRTGRAREYQHHIEPQLEQLSIANSPWLRYLHGWEAA